VRIAQTPVPPQKLVELIAGAKAAGNM